MVAAARQTLGAKAFFLLPAYSLSDSLRLILLLPSLNITGAQDHPEGHFLTQPMYFFCVGLCTRCLRRIPGLGPRPICPTAYYCTHPYRCLKVTPLQIHSCPPHGALLHCCLKFMEPSCGCTHQNMVPSHPVPNMFCQCYTTCIFLKHIHFSAFPSSLTHTTHLQIRNLEQPASSDDVPPSYLTSLWPSFLKPLRWPLTASYK